MSQAPPRRNNGRRQGPLHEPLGVPGDLLDQLAVELVPELGVVDAPLANLQSTSSHVTRGEKRGQAKEVVVEVEAPFA